MTTASARSPTPPRVRPSPARCALLLAATLAWAWAGSVFTPWALDLDHRLWLFDALYYLRFALLGWGLFEAGVAIAALAARRRPVRPMRALALLTTAAVVATLALQWGESDAGVRLAMRFSAPALAAERGAADSDARRRVGGWIVDTRRHPCGPGQPWLWLGRPFGGGTGTSRALVQAGTEVPLTPNPDAFRFRPVAGGWWLAYQHGARYAQGAATAGPCGPGTAVASHADGLGFIADGQR